MFERWFVAIINMGRAMLDGTDKNLLLPPFIVLFFGDEKVWFIGCFLTLNRAKTCFFFEFFARL
jgi:hypothetical protein